MAKFNFKESMQATNSNSILHIGREKKQWADIDGTEVTIIAVDRNLGPSIDKRTHQIVADENGEVQLVNYYTVLLKEYPDNYFGGFGALNRSIDKWIDAYDDIKTLNIDLEKSGGVQIRTRFDAGSNSRKIDVLG